VSDRHTRVLRVLARHRQRRLDESDASHPSPAGTGASDVRRADLERLAKRAKARVVAADARRRHAPGGGSPD
jgi:hypothetical protein